MTAPAITVRAIPGNHGFEVIRTGILGNRAIGFRLHAIDANQLAREHHELVRLFFQPGVTPEPTLELWEAPDAA